MTRPSLWSLGNIFYGLAKFCSEFLSSELAAFNVPANGLFVFNSCVFVKFNLLTGHCRAWLESGDALLPRERSLLCLSQDPRCVEIFLHSTRFEQTLHQPHQGCQSAILPMLRGPVLTGSMLFSVARLLLESHQNFTAAWTAIQMHTLECWVCLLFSKSSI